MLCETFFLPPPFEGVTFHSKAFMNFWWIFFSESTASAAAALKAIMLLWIVTRTCTHHFWYIRSPFSSSSLSVCLSATWTSPPVSGLSFYDFSHLIHDFVTWWKMLWLWKLYDEQYSSIVREQAYAKSVFFFFSSLFIFIFPRFMYRSKKLKTFVPKIIVENTPNW